jgi:hypothetical protein
MSKSVKVTLLVVVTLMLASAGMMFSGCSKSSDSTPAAPALPTYTGTVYMASEMGGHIGIYKITVDPNNTTNPITIVSSGKKQLSGVPGISPKHIFHDVRYDGSVAGSEKLYYSTIIPDDVLLADGTFASAPTLSFAHVGYVPLTASGADMSPSAPVDAKIDVFVAGSQNTMNLKFTGSGAASTNAKIVGLPLVYCASAITSDKFIALSMTLPAYIDVMAKSTITNGADLSTSRKRFFVEDFRGTWADAGVSLFAHGMNSSPDGTKLYLAVNEVNADATTAGGPYGDPKGAVTGYLLKMSDVTSPSVTVGPTSVLAKHTITGMAGSTSTAPTVAFRSNFTPDGSKILQSGKDRFLVLDGNTLAPLNGATGDTTIGAGKAKVENHDALSTPDGKYAILTIRYVDSDTNGFQTSGLQLYDLTTMKPVGGLASTCSSCHASGGTLGDGDHVTCGIDGKLTTNP